MKIVFEIREKFHKGGESKEGLTINEVDEVVDNLQDILPSDILTLLDGGVISRSCRYNNIIMKREESE